MIYFLGPLFIEKYLYAVTLFCNVLIEATDRRLIKKFINPSKMLTSVQLKFSYGRI